MSAETQANSADDFGPFIALIKQRAGLLFEGDSEQRLARVLRQRCSDDGTASLAEYYSRLYCDKAEFKRLINLLTINETYFFREPDQISLLVDRLLPRLMAGRSPANPVRILSAGCSSGEEPYSLAIALTEKYGEAAAEMFTLVGADIDGAMLAKARLGRFPEFSFRAAPANVQARYFVQDGAAFVLKDALRHRVMFYEHNLLADAGSPALRDFDVIFFRNVSIYFDDATRRLIQKKLAALMKAGGYLIVGTSETLANDFGLLQLIHDGSLFYFAKGRPELGQPALVPQGDFLRVVPQGRPPPPPSLDQIRALAGVKRYDEAARLLDLLLGVNANDAAALLLKSYVRMQLKDFAAAADLAQRALRQLEWSTDAFWLLGMAAKWRADPVEATRWLKQAVYVSHQCWPAHFYLAELYRAASEAEQAKRAYRIVLQLVADGRTAETGLKVVPLEIPVAEVRFLCEHQLGRLGDARIAATSARVR